MLTQSRVIINKPVREVWDFFKNPDNLKRWLNGFQRFEPVSGIPGTTGAKTKHYFLEKGKDVKIPMPLVAQQFIKLFDGFYLMPNLRVLLPEFEFAIEIPEEVIDEINIDELKALIDDRKKNSRKEIPVAALIK